MNAVVKPDPELERRNVRTALTLALLAVAFVIAFVVILWPK
jgi:hypothetical protein